jgi:probable addiction module antidote protein
MKKTNRAAVPFDEFMVESLRGDDEGQFELIKASFEDNSDMPEAILLAIRLVAEARGFKHFAETADLNRENLYRVLSEGGNPRLDTFFKIINALGLRLRVESKTKVG